MNGSEIALRTAHSLENGGSPRPPLPNRSIPRYPRNPIFFDAKFAKFGNTVESEVSGIPNHDANDAPYWSIDVVGIQRPRVSVSLGPPNANVGNAP